MHKKHLIISLILVCICYTSTAQNKLFFINKNQKKITLDFRLVSNQIIIPVQINESDTLNFILDTGLKTSIITHIPEKDSLMLKYARKLKIKGLGNDGDLEVYHSQGNTIRIKGIQGTDFSFYIILDDKFQLSAELGMEIHGLIGGDLFESFVVKIDYASLKITFYRNETFKYKRRHRKRFVTLPLIFHKSKPYLKLPIVTSYNDTLTTKLLIDTGSSDALWLFTGSNDKIKVPKNNRESYLGKGLSGNIHGFHGRIKSLQIGKYTLNDIAAAFPEMSMLQNSKIQDIKGRNGSIGAEIMRRFTVIFDYKNKKILLRKNRNFREKFNFNMAGFEVKAPYGLLPVFIVSYIRQNSPAEKAGLKKGDMIKYLNGKAAHEYNVLEINSMTRQYPGKRMRIIIERNGAKQKIKFRLIKDL